MTVYLVGAGPGDPGLLTRRGAELLGRAEVVVYDRLAAPELLNLAPGADHVCVAKAPGRHSVSQDEINRMLVEHGRAGRTVVRLEEGDPFVFARGGEECRALADAGVPFEVVPGISSAVAAPAAADEETVDWFERRPLFGTTIVVTRPADADDPLAAGLRSRGAAVVSFPVLAIEGVEPAEVPDPAAYDWVAFTSANGVRHFVSALHDARAFGSAQVAAVGPATSDALAAEGIVADLVAPVHTAAGLGDALAAADPRGARVLVPQAAQALPTLVDRLRAAGWRVDPLTVYRTVSASPDAETVDAVARAQVVTFASPSAVHAFHQLVRREQRPAVVASIGPVTSAAVRAAGRDVEIEADPHSAAGLVEALVRWRREAGGRTPRRRPGVAPRPGLTLPVSGVWVRRGGDAVASTPWNSPAGGCAGSVAPTPFAGWSPRRRCRSTTWLRRCSSATASTDRSRSRRFPAWCNTPDPPCWTRCASWPLWVSRR